MSWENPFKVVYQIPRSKRVTSCNYRFEKKKVHILCILRLYVSGHNKKKLSGAFRRALTQCQGKEISAMILLFSINLGRVIRLFPNLKSIILQKDYLQVENIQVKNLLRSGERKNDQPTYKGTDEQIWTKTNERTS